MSNTAEVKKELIKRTFEAKFYKVGSEERNRLNCDPKTSEYMTSYKYMVKCHVPETKTHLAHTYSKQFKTKAEAEIFLYE